MNPERTPLKGRRKPGLTRRPLARVHSVPTPLEFPPRVAGVAPLSYSRRAHRSPAPPCVEGREEAAMLSAAEAYKRGPVGAENAPPARNVD